MVDWNGISLYYKGPDFQNINQAQQAGFVYDVLHGYDPYQPSSGQVTPDYYATYCADKPTKACMFSEAGAAYHANASEVAAGPDTQLQVQQGWWEDLILNTTFWNTHPRMRAYYQFAWQKFENDGGIVDDRDYRISNNSDVLTAFQSAWKSVQSIFVYANSTAVAGEAAVNTSVGLNTPSGSIITSTATINQTDVITATYTNFVSDDMPTTASPASGGAVATGTGLLGSPSQTTAANIYEKSSASSTFSRPASFFGFILAAASVCLI